MAEHKMVTLTMADDAKKALPLSLHEKMIARHFSDPGDEVLIGLRDAMQAGRLAVEKGFARDGGLAQEPAAHEGCKYTARPQGNELLAVERRRSGSTRPLGQARGACRRTKRTAGPLRRRMP